MTINLADFKDILTIVSSIVAIVGPIVPFFMLPSRRRLRTDIEVLNLLKKNSGYMENQAYIKIKEKIDRNILDIYSDPILSFWQRVLYILFGIILIGVSCYFTYNFLYPEFNWWALLTIYIATVGIVYMLAGIYARGDFLYLLKLASK